MTNRLTPIVLTALLLASSVAAAQSVVRGPYLQQSTPESVVVVWRTDVETEGVVRYGTAAGMLDQTSSSSPSGTQHEMRIAGLAPATRYYYSVGDPAGALAGGDSDHYFETAPPVGSTERVRMWVVGDSGTGGTRQGEVRDAMLADVGTDTPDIFLHVGDMAYSSGTDSEFQRNFFEMYQPILRNTVCWPAMGNHEGRTSDSDTQSGPYYDAYVLPTDGSAGGVSSGTEAYYSFDRANVHFIVLDSHDSPRESTGTMAAWLQQDLAATAQDWLIAFWHHPPYTKGSHDSDNEGRLIDMREEILPILEAGGVDLVLTGHSHIYERSYLLNGAYDTPTTAQGYMLDEGDGRPNGDGPYVKPAGVSEGAVYVVAGHGGTGVSGEADHPVMYFSEVDHGSVIIDVEGDLLQLKNVRHDGVVSDDVAIAKGDGVFLLRPAPGERVRAGAPYEIRWTSTATRAVKVEFSADDGANWATLADEIVGGTFTWDVPSTPTNLARIRVTDVDDPANSDTNARPFVITDQVPEVVVPFGSIWRYDDDGGDYPDESWAQPDYDDESWKSGPGQLGYGDGDEATVLLDEDPNIPSVLFRHTVALERPADEATLEAIYDDALGVWVNGELVHEENFNVGSTFDVYSFRSSGDNAMTRAEFGPDNPFVVGDNVIAVMVKQRNETSSDLSFDLQLTVTLEPDFPDPPPPMDDQDADMAVGNGADDGPTGGGTGDTGPSGGGESDLGDPDQGDVDAGPSIQPPEGCSCRTATAGPALWLLLLAGLFGLRRVRRAVSGLLVRGS